MSSIARSVSQPVARSVQNWSSANVSKLIKSLFADGTQGMYLNAQDALSVSDLSSIKDLSGNNNHALQADSMKRTSLITDPSGYKSLKFDGIDDGYATQSINFSNTDKVTVIAAVRKLSDIARGTLVELGDTTNNGTFGFQAPAVNGSPDYSFSSKGTLSRSASSATFPAPNSSIVRGVGSVVGMNARLYVNQNPVAENLLDQGTGNYGNYPLYIGRRAGTSLPFNGQIYALLIIGKLLDDATTQRIEKEFAKYIGVTL